MEPGVGGGGAELPDLAAPPTVCSSGTMWTRGDRGSEQMHPGLACLTCHAQNPGAPKLVFAGTVYPTVHEPDDCNGVAASAGAQVIVTDANGLEVTLTPNAAGNFLEQKAPSGFAFPITAKVVVGDKERAMLTPQASGDCNSCHTVDGANGAPGRIYLPE